MSTVQGGGNIITDGLVLYLDAANSISYPRSGTTWSDISRGGNSGTLTNGPTFSSARGGAIVLDGADDYVAINNIQTTSNFTYDFIFDISNLTDTSDNSLVKGNAAYGGKIITFDPNDKVFVGSTSADSTAYVFFDNYNWFTDRGLHHYTITIEYTITTTLKLYVDGVLKNTKSSSNYNNYLPIFNSIVYAPEASYSAHLFRLYNRTLSAQEVLQNYNATKARFSITEYEPEYLAVLSYATSQGFTLPSTAQNDKNNIKIRLLKEQGIFNELDLLYNFKQPAGLGNFSRINWVNPGTYNVTQSNPALVPAFEADKGYKGNQNNGSFFSTNYIPSANATNAILDDVGVFFKTYEEISGSVAGTRNSSFNNFAIGKSTVGDSSTTLHGTTVGGNLYRNASLGETDPASHIVHAKNNDTHSYYVNGVFTTSAIYSSTSSFLSTHELTVFANNNGGTKISLFTGGIEYFGLGSSYVKDKAAELESIFSV